MANKVVKKVAKKVVKKVAKTPVKKPRRAVEPPADAELAPVEAALANAARTAFAALRATGDTFYGFALYTSGELSYVTATGFSEEGLAEVVASYRAKPRHAKTPVATLRAQLRWSPDDSPHHDTEADAFEDVPMATVGTALRAAYARGATDGAAYRARVFATFVRVLRALDTEGAFGTGAARARTFVSVMMGDQDESVLEVARQVNPPAAVALYRP